MGIDVAGTIYDGVDRRHFFPPESGRAARDPVTVLYAGSLRLYKRVPLVIQEAARWPQVRFRIAGVGEEEQNCKSLISDLGCSNVDLLGHLSQRQLGEEMRRADIFYFPSVLEGHPQVLIQAAASGLPIIAMNVYRPDYVVSGVTGFLVETDDELSAKLNLLIHRRDLREAMGTAAVAHAQRFDWDAIALTWQNAFEQVVAMRRKR
jgi:glycosyltransferase involved in cell wall biosynthesis